MMAMFNGLPPGPGTSVERGQNLLSGAAPFYRCYTCADGKDVAVGPLEPHFYAILLERMGAPSDLGRAQNDSKQWETQAADLAALFATKSRADWCALLEGTDACFAPVLTLDEAPLHPQICARGTYIERDGLVHPAPAPRFSRTPASIGDSGDGRRILETWGISHPPASM